MSGPIVRKYGFPNFEKIFGERDLKHGAEGQSDSPKAPEAGSKASEDSKPPKAEPDTSKP